MATGQHVIASSTPPPESPAGAPPGHNTYVHTAHLHRLPVVSALWLWECLDLDVQPGSATATLLTCSGFIPSAIPAVQDGPRGAFDCFSATVCGCWSVITLAPPTPQIFDTQLLLLLFYFILFFFLKMAFFGCGGWGGRLSKTSMVKLHRVTDLAATFLGSCGPGPSVLLSPDMDSRPDLFRIQSYCYRVVRRARTNGGFDLNVTLFTKLRSERMKVLHGNEALKVFKEDVLHVNLTWLFRFFCSGRTQPQNL